MLTPGFMERYGTEIVGCDCTIVANVAIDEIEPVAAEIAAVVDAASMVVGTITDEQSTILDEAVGVEVGALLIAAAISAVASIVVMLQAVARQMAGRRTDATSLNAIGATRADRAVAWTTVLAPSAVAGTIGAVAIAFALSPIFHRGIARQAEVDTGRHLDPIALVGGAAALFAVIALGRDVLRVAVHRRHEGHRGGRRTRASDPLARFESRRHARYQPRVRSCW